MNQIQNMDTLVKAIKYERVPQESVEEKIRMFDAKPRTGKVKNFMTSDTDGVIFDL